jgi:hypothetical protein
MSLLVSPGAASSQKRAVPAARLDRYFSELPRHVQLKEDSPQKYLFTCDYFYLDTLGNLTGKERVTGEYTRALPEGKARWNNVRIAKGRGFEDIFPEGELQKYMEDFAYTLSNPSNMFKQEFFSGFPATELKTKNLVWDTYMIEQFAWNYWDKLELNIAHRPQSKPEDVALAGGGTFQNRQVELTWAGISKMNSKTCALIQYQAFINKVNVSTPNANFQGRSHYWGQIWVALQDKQIEHATLYEDVLMEFTLQGQSAKRIINPFRQATLQRAALTKDH